MSENISLSKKHALLTMRCHPSPMERKMPVVRGTPCFRTPNMNRWWNIQSQSTLAHHIFLGTPASEEKIFAFFPGNGNCSFIFDDLPKKCEFSSQPFLPMTLVIQPMGNYEKVDSGRCSKHKTYQTSNMTCTNTIPKKWRTQ